MEEHVQTCPIEDEIIDESPSCILQTESPPAASFSEETLEPPISLGSDLAAVEWVNDCLHNIFSSSTLRSTLIQLWMDALSKYTKSLDVEENVAIVYEGLLKHTSLPKITNLITQVHPSTNMVT